MPKPVLEAAPSKKSYESFRDAVLKYKGMTVETLQNNIDYFLKRVVRMRRPQGLCLTAIPMILLIRLS